MITEKYINSANYFHYIELLKKKKVSFQVAVTGYTTVIKTPSTKYIFAPSQNSKRLFFTYKKLTAEIKQSGILPPKINRANIDYYGINNSIENKKAGLYGNVYNVDINAAYPTALYNLKYINKKMFDELMNLPKMERLKIVGMIATSKNIYTYYKGVFIRDEIKKDEYLRGVFFHVVEHVGHVMQRAARSSDSFIFFWVDGVYFHSLNDAEKIRGIIEQNKFKCSFEELHNFETERRKNNIFIRYDKKGNEKTFSIPIFERNKRLNELNKIIKSNSEIV